MLRCSILLACALLTCACQVVLGGAALLWRRPAATSPFKEELGYEKKTTKVLGATIAYVDTGASEKGKTFVFLHGNPTSSYLWRNVIPFLEPHGRCLAPDLVGMGDSSRLPFNLVAEDHDRKYSLTSHARYLEAFMAQVGATSDVVLVTHDWGSTLGFDWARKHPEAVSGMAFVEPIMPTGGSFASSAMPLLPKVLFKTLQTFLGELLVLKFNLNVNVVLHKSILRKLSPAEVSAYAEPFAEAGENRRATLAWPRQVPFDGKPTDVVDMIVENEKWLQHGGQVVPKLWLRALPGSMVLPDVAEFLLGLQNVEVVDVKGLHYVQEDSPHAIGRAVAGWQARALGN